MRYKVALTAWMPPVKNGSRSLKQRKEERESKQFFRVFFTIMILVMAGGIFYYFTQLTQNELDERQRFYILRGSMQTMQQKLNDKSSRLAQWSMPSENCTFHGGAGLVAGGWNCLITLDTNFASKDADAVVNRSIQTIKDSKDLFEFKKENYYKDFKEDGAYTMILKDKRTQIGCMLTFRPDESEAGKLTGNFHCSDPAKKSWFMNQESKESLAPDKDAWQK